LAVKRPGDAEPSEPGIAQAAPVAQPKKAKRPLPSRPMHAAKRPCTPEPSKQGNNQIPWGQISASAKSLWDRAVDVLRSAAPADPEPEIQEIGDSDSEEPTAVAPAVTPAEGPVPEEALEAAEPSEGGAMDHGGTASEPLHELPMHEEESEEELPAVDDPQIDEPQDHLPSSTASSSDVRESAVSILGLRVEPAAQKLMAKVFRESLAAIEERVQSQTSSMADLKFRDRCNPNSRRAPLVNIKWVVTT
ncbi:unnamed protein product, partial [Symbiodinium pilosum]